MRIPDTRPIGVLTAEILATASHWAFRGTNGMLIAANSDIKLHMQTDDSGNPNQWVVVWASSALRPSTTCYPCTLQPNGLVVPEPWPVLDGEEEIEEWSVFAATWQGQAQIAHSLQSTSEGFILGWTMQVIDEYNDVIAESPHVARPNMHPAPRKGKLGPVWVWEADKC